MEAEQTDIFISYRREDGRELARTLYLALGKLGYQNIFFDYNSMRGGTFNTQIDVAISQCKDFILVLSPCSMERCVLEGDWVAHEIRSAIQAGCNIVPVAIEQNYVAWPQDMPRDMNVMKMLQQRILATNELFEASVQLIADTLVSKPVAAEHDVAPKCELTITADETSTLWVDGQAQGKVKGGKQRVMSLPADYTYTIKLESLARKGEELTQEVAIKRGETSKTVAFGFCQMRENQWNKLSEERMRAQRLKEEQRIKEGLLKQSVENYDEAGELQDGMKVVALSHRVGYLNDTGFEAVVCEWDDGSDFRGGFATVCKGGMWGIIDKIGQVMAPLCSETPCWLQSNNAFFVASRNQHYGISTIQRGAPTSFPYEEVRFIHGYDNLLAVRKGGFWSIIDVEGAVSPFTMQVNDISGSSWGSINRFLYGRCDDVYELYPPLGVQHPGSGRWGYLNSRLQLTVPFVDEDSMEATCLMNMRIIKTNGRMGLVNVETGELILPVIYENIHRISNEDYDPFYRIADGATCYQYEKDPKKGTTKEDTRYLWGGKQGVANNKGEIIVPQKYQYIHNYGDPPCFGAYILNDLRLSWEERGWGTRFSLQHTFNRGSSIMHIYTSEGEIIGTVPVTDEEKARSIIYNHR